MREVAKKSGGRNDGAVLRRSLPGEPNRTGAELNVDLLRQHVATERNPPVERHRREVRTLAPFHFRPGLHRRNHPRQSRAHEIEQPEVEPNRADVAPLLGPFRAQMQELDHAHKILAGGRLLDSRHVAHFRRKRLLDRRSDQRTAIRDEQLQQRSYGSQKYDGSHYRGTTASRAGTMRASGDNRQNAYAHASGNRHPKTGTMYPISWKFGSIFPSAKVAANALKYTPSDSTN